MSHFSKLMLAALTAPTFAVVASAQVTTSAINGSVVDENNGPCWVLPLRQYTRPQARAIVQ